MRIVVDRDQRLAPQIFCDHCGEQITDAKDGNYQWEYDEQLKPTDGQVYFTHKRCCLAFEHARGGRSGWAAMELCCLPVYMAANLRLDWKKAKELAAQMSAM